jgi:hypothetical protein
MVLLFPVREDGLYHVEEREGEKNTYDTDVGGDVMTKKKARKATPKKPAVKRSRSVAVRYDDPAVPLPKRIAAVRQKIARIADGDDNDPAAPLHVLHQVLAGLLLLGDRACGAHTDETGCTADVAADCH